MTGPICINDRVRVCVYTTAERKKGSRRRDCERARARVCECKGAAGDAAAAAAVAVVGAIAAGTRADGYA